MNTFQEVLLLLQQFSKKKFFAIYIYTYRLYVKKYIFVAGGGASFFFWWSLGPQWSYSNRFCSYYFFSQKIPLINLYFEKKKRVCSGGWNGGSFLVVIGTPMNTFQQVSLWWQLFRRKTLVASSIRTHGEWRKYPYFLAISVWKHEERLCEIHPYK